MGDYVYLVIGVFVIVPLLFLWLWCVFDAFTRPDLTFTLKALWAITVLVFPLAGAAAYLYFRSKRRPFSEDAIGNYQPMRTSSSDAPDWPRST
jgi:hypothetical protein